MSICILCQEPTDGWPIGTPDGIWVYLCPGCRHEPDWIAIKRRIDSFVGEIQPIERNKHLKRFVLEKREVETR